MQQLTIIVFTCYIMVSVAHTEPLVLEREVEGREEGGEGEGGLDDGQENSCQVLPGEEAEV